MLGGACPFPQRPFSLENTVQHAFYRLASWTVFLGFMASGLEQELGAERAGQKLAHRV